ncbi:MAG: hypothetical protein M1823_004423 [Watsoniomyces obsoletus]|nr:MAG: hypothetical protein M1823_004423 [Watsoniomyces obsoletus]
MFSVVRQTPAWLADQTPGCELFTAPSTSNRSTPPKPGPSRTIARRGQEIFVAVGNQLRWADLTILQEKWRAEHHPSQKAASTDQEKDGAHGIREDERRAHYRVLKVPVWEDIRQLIISPRGDLIAILTSHTVHVAVLPDPSHLRASHSSPIKLKAYTVGSTAHVLTRAPLASAVWHPLGVSGHCLVTTTSEAIVRIWEFDLGNRWSFDSPSLTINLRRLADNLPQDQDRSWSRMSASKVFSPDAVEMEVAATCFGGSPRAEQDPWAPMTLWVAMRQGDVYALCPLLPSKWSSPPSLVPSLSATILSKHASRKMELSTTDVRRQVGNEQVEWIREVENQQYMPQQREQEEGPEMVFHKRPENPDVLPALQGPFDVDLLMEDDENGNEVFLTDIYTIAGRSSSGFASEEPQFAAEPIGGDSLSWGMVCLLTGMGRLHVLLDTEGVEGRWPSKTLRSSQNSIFSESDDIPCLLNFESLDLSKAGALSHSMTNWPLFTPSLDSAYSVFVTHGQEVTQLSFKSLVKALEQELQGNVNAGLDLRLDVIANSATTETQRMIKSGDTKTPLASHGLPASVIFPSSDLEYLLLTAGDEGPVALVLDTPRLGSSGGLSDSPMSETTPFARLRRTQWPPYQPSHEFFSQEPLRPLLMSQRKSENSEWLSKEVKYTQPTAILLGSVHSAVSQHREHVSNAATDLFQNCTRMLSEFQDQVRSLKEIRSRVDRLLGEDRQEEGSEKQDEQGKQKGEEGIQRRVEKVKSRHQDLLRRLEALQQKEASLGPSVISVREEAWMAELQKVASNVVPDKGEEEEEYDDDDDENEPPEHVTIKERYYEIKHLTTELLPEVEHVSKREPKVVTTPIKVPSAIRQKKVQQVMQMLDREYVSFYRPFLLPSFPHHSN